MLLGVMIVFMLDKPDIGERNDMMRYKLVIVRDWREWFWELQQKNGRVEVSGNIGYSTKSNARRAFWALFSEINPNKIQEV